jgi:hypothetical protein
MQQSQRFVLWALVEALPRIARRHPLPGSWSSGKHVGHELIAAGMMILAGGSRGVPLDYGELERWTRVGYERGTRSRKGER